MHNYIYTARIHHPAMNGDRVYCKEISRNGNSLVVAVTREARRMRLKEGDEVFITVSPANGSMENRFEGAAALSLMEQGYVLASDGRYFALGDGKGALEKGVLYVALAEPQMAGGENASELYPDSPVGDMEYCTLPREVFYGTVLTSVLYHEEFEVTDLDRSRMERSTKAWFALLEDAKAILGGLGRASRNESMLLEAFALTNVLNDIGWDYDARSGRGVYDTDRLKGTDLYKRLKAATEKKQ